MTRNICFKNEIPKRRKTKIIKITGTKHKIKVKFKRKDGTGYNHYNATLFCSGRKNCKYCKLRIKEIEKRGVCYD